MAKETQAARIERLESEIGLMRANLEKALETVDFLNRRVQAIGKRVENSATWAAKTQAFLNRVKSTALVP